LRFRTLADNAGVSHVTASMLRDGAATAAASANVNEKLCALLLGHRSGISDHYVKRNPQMVAPACQAVYNRYFQKPLTIAKDKAA
jgi:integrase